MSDQEGNRITSTQQVDLLSQYSKFLQTFMGQSQFNRWYQEVEKVRKQYNIPTLTIPIDLTSEIVANIQVDLYPELQPPTIEATSTYDPNIKETIVTVNITPAQNTKAGALYEIQYSLQGPEFADQRTIFSTNTNVSFVTPAAVSVWIRQRARLLNSVSRFSDIYYIEKTARDEVPPSPAIVLKNEPRYLGTHIELQPFEEKDFAYCYITFSLDGETFKFTSTNNILDIYVGKTYSNIPANIYVVDTSGNQSEQTPVIISSQTFSQQEKEIEQRILNTEGQLELLNSVQTIEGKVTSVDQNNKRIGTDASLFSQQAGYICAIEHDNVLYEYKIEQIDYASGLLTIDDVPNASVGDKLWIISPIYGRKTTTEQLSKIFNNTISKITNTEISESFSSDNVTIQRNILTDLSKNFVQLGVDTTFFVKFDYEDNTSEIVNIIDIQNEHALVLQKEPSKTPISYTIYSPYKFVSSSLAQDYTGLSSMVTELSYKVTKSNYIDYIDQDKKIIADFDQDFNSIPPGSLLKIHDDNYTWTYTIQQVNDNVIYLNTSLMLDQFQLGKQKYEIYKLDNALQSFVIQTAQEFSSAIANKLNNTESVISQLSNELQFKVTGVDLNGNPVVTALTIHNGKIVADAKQFQINGNQLVTGTIDQGKARIQSGNSVIDGSGIHIKQGDIQLGLNQDTGLYNTLIRKDGSGYLAQNKIQWNQDGSLYIDATNGGEIRIKTNSFKLSDGQNLVSFKLENGKFVFDGNIEIRNGLVQFESLDDYTKQSIEQLIIKLDQIDGNVLDSNTKQTTIRQRIYFHGEEANASDTTANIQSNKFTYIWYKVIDGQEVEIPEFRDMPEITISRSDVDKKLQIVCVQDWKNK